MSPARFDLARIDTICALATAAAPAAIAVIRVSGPDAEHVRDVVFRKRRPGPIAPFVATLGEVVDHVGALLDEALCTSFPVGRSYTGEASFELSLHGGPSRVRSTLRALIDAGCRPAEPGEFTLRAVLTGRLDLARAEAVADVINARSDDAARAALASLRGGLADALAPVRTALIDTLAELEARLDFPDEDLGDAEASAIDARLREAIDRLDRLLAGAAFGERLTDGARVVLYGVPNTGKSTLLNALVGEERALVHDTPGTTRDVLEAEVVLGGVPATLIDVAGVRDGRALDPVERMGIERARIELQRADVVVLVVDATRPDARPSDVPSDATDESRAPIVVHNKGDLLDDAPLDDAPPDDAALDDAALDDAPLDGALRVSALRVSALRVSALRGDGLDALRALLAARLTADAPAGDEVLLTRARQREEVAAARDGLAEARSALAALTPHEVVAAELRRAGTALDRLLGTELSEDVLDVVFTRFCIGK